MSTLRDLELRAVYRSEFDNLLEDFYIPCLTAAVQYDRAVGFFSTSMLSYAAQGISALVTNGGKMRLIFGGEIPEEDADAIASGYDLKKLTDRLGTDYLSVIDNLSGQLANNRLNTVAWMIGSGLLEIKVALKRRGMYHEKIGIFTDASGDRVVFQGSANETSFALLPDFNFESINVFSCWRKELSDHYEPYIDGFERLWRNETRDTLVVDFPEAVREKLVKIASRVSCPPRIEIELDVWKKLVMQEVAPAQVGTPVIPQVYKGGQFDIRPHQRAALNAWLSSDLQGLMAMATGSGKTITSIYGLTKIYEKLGRLFVVIAVPYQPLADQWVEEFALFKVNAIRCYESVSEWSSKLTEAISLFDSGALNFCACVVVNRTLVSEEFQKRIHRINGEYLAFIGDECHYHSASAVNESLPRQAKIRLGLSATPEHYLDSTKTEALLKYYGPVVYEYSLRDALNDGILTPYRYFLHFVDLTEAEADLYHELSTKISRLVGSGARVDADGDSEDDGLKVLLFRRARLLGSAQNKLKILEELIRGQRPTPYTLFYCGDGQGIEDPSPQLRQVDKVSSLLSEYGWKVSHFTSQESLGARSRILEGFRHGVIDGLVAIRCLDEGVDVPECRTAFILASSRNPKQFIQRRGRILRRAPNKEVAIVHDFLIRLPSRAAGVDSVQRALLINELSRVSEFGSLAQNRSEVYEQLKDTLETYDLQHYFL